MKAQFAGTFYPEDLAILKSELKKFIGERKPINKIKAVIVPHAGYSYSGKTAGKVYSMLPNSEIYVILGTSHKGENAIGDEKIITPLGKVETDSEFCKMLSDKTDLKINNEAFINEHSIEVQLPFLQFCFSNFSIVPIILNYDYSNFDKLADAIDKVAKEKNKKIIVICSSDLTHYGRAYGFLPFPPDKKKIYEIDKKIISRIMAIDSGKFLSEALRSTVCGVKAIATCIEYANTLGLKAKLVDYSNSGDSTGYENCVGYAGIIFNKS